MKVLLPYIFVMMLYASAMIACVAIIQKIFCLGNFGVTALISGCITLAAMLLFTICDWLS